VQELRYYRSTIFVPAPGPSSEEARQIAGQLHGGEGALSDSPPAELDESAGSAPGRTPGEAHAPDRVEGAGGTPAGN